MALVELVAKESWGHRPPRLSSVRHGSLPSPAAIAAAHLPPIRLPAA